MAFQSVPNTILVEVRATAATQDVEITLYYEQPAGYNEETVEDLADGIDSLAGTMLPDLLNTNTTYRETYAKGLESVIDFQALANAFTAVGTQAGTNPNNCALAIARRSGLTGRSARGRIFTFGVYDAATLPATQVFTAAYGDGWIDFLNTADALAVTQGLVPVIVSRYTAGALRPVGLTIPITEWAYADLGFDSMRGRLPKES